MNAATKTEYLKGILYDRENGGFPWCVEFNSDTIGERIKKHNSNHKGFTGGKGDWVLKFIQNFTEKSEAITRE